MFFTTNRKGIIAIIILTLLIAGLLYALLFVPIKAPLKEAGVSTYTSTKYGFSFMYPKEASVREGNPDRLYLEPENGNATTVLSVAFPRVDTFSENQSHGYYQYQIRFTLTPLLECNPSDSYNTGEHLIRSESWAGAYRTVQVFAGEGAAVGNRLKYTRYAFCNGNLLYSIYDVFASGSDGAPLTEKLQADIRVGEKANKAILSSFKLLPAGVY